MKLLQFRTLSQYELFLNHFGTFLLLHRSRHHLIVWWCWVVQSRRPVNCAAATRHGLARLRSLSKDAYRMMEFVGTFVQLDLFVFGTLTLVSQLFLLMEWDLGKQALLALTAQSLLWRFVTEAISPWEGTQTAILVHRFWLIWWIALPTRRSMAFLRSGRLEWLLWSSRVYISDGITSTLLFLSVIPFFRSLNWLGCNRDQLWRNFCMIISWEKLPQLTHLFVLLSGDVADIRHIWVVNRADSVLSISSYEAHVAGLALALHRLPVDAAWVAGSLILVPSLTHH